MVTHVYITCTMVFNLCRPASRTAGTLHKDIYIFHQLVGRTKRRISTNMARGFLCRPASRTAGTATTMLTYHIYCYCYCYCYYVN